MNSSDEEKQLQLITSLKEQGRRARGPGAGRLPGAGVAARGSGVGGGAAAWAPAELRDPWRSILRAPRASESPGPRGARGCGECCPPVALAGDLRSGGKGRGFGGDLAPRSRLPRGISAWGRVPWEGVVRAAQLAPLPSVAPPWPLGAGRPAACAPAFPAFQPGWL